MVRGKNSGSSGVSPKRTRHYHRLVDLDEDKPNSSPLKNGGTGKMIRLPKLGFGNDLQGKTRCSTSGG